MLQPWTFNKTVNDKRRVKRNNNLNIQKVQLCFNFLKIKLTIQTKIFVAFTKKKSYAKQIIVHIL